MIIIEKYEIRFAERDDIPAIMQYIDDYWRKGHILAAKREIFEWQYVNYNRVNFVIGVDIDNNIQGILGFVPYSSNEDKDIALALWKANQAIPFLGIRLLLFLKNQEKPRNIVCPGINMKTTEKIYRQFGFKVDVMNQWYRLSKREEYVIAKTEDDEIPKCNSFSYSLRRLIHGEEIEKTYCCKIDKNENIPFKSLDYLKKRYFNHPAYDYLVYDIMDDKGQSNGIVVLRIQECKGSQVIRFVDFVGENETLGKITTELDKIVDHYDAEYIDMYETGIDENVLLRAGWRKVKDTRNIIPNYFAPYEQSVVDIYYCSSNENAIMFRGDGDQDRPN